MFYLGEELQLAVCCRFEPEPEQRVELHIYRLLGLGRYNQAENRYQHCPNTCPRLVLLLDDCVDQTGGGRSDVEPADYL